MAGRQTTNLIGKGGVGLVMFHMARLNHEFTPTTESSNHGDLWVEFDGKKESVEVKTSNLGYWTVRFPQAKIVDRFVFVNLASAGVWMISSEKLLSSLNQCDVESGKQVRITTNFIEKVADSALHRIAPPPLALPKRKRPTHITGKWTVVRKRLASGEEKVYRYPR